MMHDTCSTPQEMRRIEEVKPLLIRPRPAQHESWYGYLIRVSDQNGLMSFRVLLELFESLDHFQNALRLNDTEIASLGGPKPKKLNGGKRENLFNDNVSFFRWCPECFKHHSVHQARWHLTYYAVCLQHKIQLQDLCPNCHQRQLLDRPHLLSCQFCGADLRAAVKLAVDPLIYEYQQKIIEAYEGNVATTLYNLTYYELIKLTRYIGLFNDLDMPTKPGKIHGTTEVGIAFRVLSVAASLLSQWPTLLYELFSKVQAQSTVSLSIKHHFGTFYKVLYVNLKEECYQFLREAFEEYLFMFWPSLINKRNRSFEKVKTATHSRLTIKQMAVKTGVKPALIKHLISINQIKLEAVPLPSGRQVRLIHEKYAEELAVLAHEVISLKQLALNVGVTQYRLRQLIKTEQIKPLASKFALNSGQWYFEHDQVARLSFNAISLHQKCIPIKQILKSWRLTAAEFNALVNGLMMEELIIYSEHKLVVFLGDVWLDPKPTEEWLSNYRASVSEYLSVDQAAKQLQIKQEVAYHLVRKSILRSRLTRDRMLRIPAIEIESFKKSYISLKDVSMHLGLSPRKILNSLHTKPVCGPTIDGCRQYFYRRTDLAILS